MLVQSKTGLRAGVEERSSSGKSHDRRELGVYPEPVRILGTVWTNYRYDVIVKEEKKFCTRVRKNLFSFTIS